MPVMRIPSPFLTGMLSEVWTIRTFGCNQEILKPLPPHCQWRPCGKSELLSLSSSNEEVPFFECQQGSNEEPRCPPPPGSNEAAYPPFPARVVSKNKQQELKLKIYVGPRTSEHNTETSKLKLKNHSLYKELEKSQTE